MLDVEVVGETHSARWRFAKLNDGVVVQFLVTPARWIVAIEETVKLGRRRCSGVASQSRYQRLKAPNMSLDALSGQSS